MNSLLCGDVTMLVPANHGGLDPCEPVGGTQCPAEIEDWPIIEEEESVLEDDGVACLGCGLYDADASTQQNWIMCDACNGWWHLLCGGVEVVPKGSWTCINCCGRGKRMKRAPVRDDFLYLTP